MKFGRRYEPVKFEPARFGSVQRDLPTERALLIFQRSPGVRRRREPESGGKILISLAHKSCEIKSSRRRSRRTYELYAKRAAHGEANSRAGEMDDSSGDDGAGFWASQ